jgi:hypothetical protein
MPVSNTHPLYAENLESWSLVRDSINGQSAIKAKSTAYLPKPSGQDEAQYNSYKNRATYTMFTARTIEGLYGQVFSKEPEKKGELPERFQNFLDNIDLAGNSIDQFASDLVYDVLQTGWGGILVDHAPVPEGTNQADQDKYNLTSFMRWYSAESIINWRYDVVNHKKILALVVLQENYYAEGKDEFTPIQRTRYRVLKLVDGIYVQEVWEKNEAENNIEKQWVVADIIDVKMNGKPLESIPFFPCPANEPEKSMLLPIAYLNIGHYQLTADYNNLLHYTGTPTPYAAGVDPPRDDKGDLIQVSLGGTSILFLKGNGEPNPRIAYLEPSGTGAAQLLNSIENIKKDIEVMGADLVRAKKKGVETAEAARIHQAGENAVLGSFSLNMSEKLTQAIRLGAIWRGVPEEIAEQFTYSLNMDYEGDLSDHERVNQGIRLFESDLIDRRTFLTDFLDWSDEEADEEEKLIEGNKPDYSIHEKTNA